jgi:multidrug resistance efflux pump
MQLPTSGASPAAPAPEPIAAPHPPRGKPSEGRPTRWIVLGVLVFAALAGLYLYRQQAERAQQERAAVHVLRTARAGSGNVARTLRLTGVTAAENSASLLTPQLRGRRSGGSGSSSSSALTVQMPTAVQSNASSASSSSSSSSGTSTSGIGASAGFSTKNAFQSATSRNLSSSSSSKSSSASSSAASASATDSSASLGSTASALPNRSGGGAGGSDWMLNLKDLIKPGTIVKRGEQVAEFDRQYMLLRLDDYYASVVQDQNTLASLKAQLEVAWKAHEQSRRSAQASVDKAKLDIKTIPVRSAIDSEKLHLALEEAQAKLKELEAEVKHLRISQGSEIRDRELQVRQTDLEYRRARNNVDKLLVKAPIGGLVVMQNLWRGGEMAQIQSGDQLWPGMIFMRIVDTRTMVIDANINQADIESLRLGMKAHIRFDAYPDLELPARVISIGAMTRSGGMRQNYVKIVPVRLRFERLDPRVIPDLSVSADVQLEAEQAPATVPLEAVFRSPGSPKPFVYVQEQAAWRRREVELGLLSNLTATVRSGLQPGELVALEPPAAATTPASAAKE